MEILIGEIAIINMKMITKEIINIIATQLIITSIIIIIFTKSIIIIIGLLTKDIRTFIRMNHKYQKINQMIQILNYIIEKLILSHIH
jgi:hypothetical protein